MESAPTWGVCGGGNVPGFEFQRCGGCERPPYGAGETRRPPGKMQFPRPLQTHVGDDARIVPGCSRRRGVREGHAPPLHAVRGRPAKWDCRSRPGERRPGCPHPAAPCGRAGSAGGINPAPTGKFCVPGKPGATMFAPVCRGGPWPSRGGTRQGRPGRYRIGPYMGCLRRRGVPGTMRASSPTYLCNYARSAFSRQTRTSSTVVGADSISARFTAARGSAGGINPAPTNKFYVLGQPRRPLIPNS